MGHSAALLPSAAVGSPSLKILNPPLEKHGEELRAFFCNDDPVELTSGQANNNHFVTEKDVMNE